MNVFKQTMALLISLMAMEADSHSKQGSGIATMEKRGGVGWTTYTDSRVDVSRVITEQGKEIDKVGQTPIVYVGATWCEPCLRFKQAVKTRRLDDQLTGLHFLEFDLDRHRGGLESARYQSRMIPLFCIPNLQTGESTGRCMQGSVKGPGAIENIVPRLKELLADGAPKPVNKNR